MNPAERTRWICEQARDVGFDLYGVVTMETRANGATEAFSELEHLPVWLARGYAGEMKYLSDPRRADPRLALEGARSVIVVALNYNAPEPRSIEQSDAEDEAPRGWISRYAWGDDYHEVLWEKLNALIAAMRAEFPEPFEARTYADTGPVIERVAAKYAGLGWLAKNTFLINQQIGSWLFLGVILTTMELAPSLAPGEAPAPRFVRQLHALPGRVPDAGVPATLRAGRATVHFVSHHRVARSDPRRVAHREWKRGDRVRHLPGCVPVESQGAGDAAGCVSTAKNFDGRRK